MHEGDQIELFWPRVKSYVELVRADPNIPNGILSTGDNLKCLKRLRPAQQHCLCYRFRSEDNAELVAKLDTAVDARCEYRVNTK